MDLTLTLPLFYSSFSIKITALNIWLFLQFGDSIQFLFRFSFMFVRLFVEEVQHLTGWIVKVSIWHAAKLLVFAIEMLIHLERKKMRRKYVWTFTSNYMAQRRFSVVIEFSRTFSSSNGCKNLTRKNVDAE